MRILMDFEMNREMETYNGIRVCNVEEIKRTELCPIWKPGSKPGDKPDILRIFLYETGINRTEENLFAISGDYVLDGTDTTFNNALVNYNKVVNQLLVHGYAKISDFINVRWE